MYKNHIRTLLLISICSLMSCVSKSDNDDLVAENERLKAELNDCKYGTELLYEKSVGYLKSDDLSSSKAYLDTLILKHPESRNDTAISSLEFRIHKALAEEQERLASQQQKARDKELQRIKVEEQRIAKAVSKMDKKHDKFQKVTWYESGNDDWEGWDNGSLRFYLYFKVSDNEEKADNLRLRIDFNDNDQLRPELGVVEGYIFLIDGSVFKYFPRSISSISDGLRTYERSDNIVNKELLEIINLIVSGDKIELRINGSSGNRECILGKTQIEALKYGLVAYKALGGSLDFEY